MSAPIDLTGTRLEKASVLGLASSTSSTRKNRLWLCRCDCGRDFTSQTQAITRGTTRWCRACSVRFRPSGAGRIDDLTGRDFGTWRVVSRVGTDERSKRPLWLLRCACGNEKTRNSSAISKGVGACRCSRPPRHSDHPLYTTWTGMRQRCLCKTAEKYPDYGGRGIKICERWMKFENFAADMGDKPIGMSLDRIDVHGDYEPANCRWATSQEQADNQRLSLQRVRSVLRHAEHKAGSDPSVTALEIIVDLRRVLLGDSA